MRSCSRRAGLADGARARRPLRLGGRASGELALRLRCRRWGALPARPGSPCAPATRSGSSCYEPRSTAPSPLRVYPREERFASLVRPARDPDLRRQRGRARGRATGSSSPTCARSSPGDRVRRINWRASARRGELWVNERHPERNTDVIVFLDTFAEARREAAGTLDLAVRAASALASRYLARERPRRSRLLRRIAALAPPVDRARTQVYRIVDALLDTEVALSYAWKGIDVIPPRHAAAAGARPRADAAPRRADDRPRCSTCARAASTSRSSTSRRCPSSAPARATRAASRASGSCGATCSATATSARRAGRGVARGQPLPGQVEEVRAFRRARPRWLARSRGALAALALAGRSAAHAALRLDGDAAGGVAFAGGAVSGSPRRRSRRRLGPAVTIALVGLGGTYVLSLALDAGGVDRAAAIYAVTFLLAAELAYWSLELRAARGLGGARRPAGGRPRAPRARRRSPSPPSSSRRPGPTWRRPRPPVAGVLSAVAALALVWALASRARAFPRRSDRPADWRGRGCGRDPISPRVTRGRPHGRLRSLAAARRRTSASGPVPAVSARVGSQLALRP